jgi:hypothetical protein
LLGDDIHAARSVRAVAQASSPPEDRLDVAILELDGRLDVRSHGRRGAIDGAPPVGVVRLVGFGANEVTGKTGFGVKRVVDVPVFGWGCDASRAERIRCRPADEIVVPRYCNADTCPPQRPRPPRRRRLRSVGSRSRRRICTR